MILRNVQKHVEKHVTLDIVALKKAQIVVEKIMLMFAPSTIFAPLLGFSAYPPTLFHLLQDEYFMNVNMLVKYVIS